MSAYSSSNDIPSFKKILIPHDGSEMSDKSLKNAIYLSILSKASIVILTVVESENIPPSVLLAFIKEGEGIEQAKQKLRDLIELDTKQLLEEKVKLCNDYGVHNVSFLIKEGKPTDEIIKTVETVKPDIIIMASSRISSPIRVLGSTVRKVLDSIRKPVLIIHE